MNSVVTLRHAQGERSDTGSGTPFYGSHLWHESTGRPVVCAQATAFAFVMKGPGQSYCTQMQSVR